MNRKLRIFSISSRPAISLIEVVVGLALLGGLLVSILMATSRITRQNIHTQQRLEAIRALDQLLISFEAKTLAVSGQTNGYIEDFPNLAWSATPIPSSENRLFGTRLIHLGVYRIDRVANAPLASVDLVVADDRLLEDSYEP
jgi:type II secretory pathway pseudopilin PulG